MKKNDEENRKIEYFKSMKLRYINFIFGVLCVMTDTLSDVSDGYDGVNWKKIQKSLSELAKPFIEKIGK